MAKQKWTKQQWADYNREAQEANQYALDHGKREVLAEKIARYDQEIDGWRKDAAALKEELGRVHRLLAFTCVARIAIAEDLRILNYGPAKWRRACEAVAEMDDRED